MTMLPDVDEQSWRGYEADDFSRKTSSRINSMGFMHDSSERIGSLFEAPTGSDSLTNPLGAAVSAAAPSAPAAPVEYAPPAPAEAAAPPAPPPPQPTPAPPPPPPPTPTPPPTSVAPSAPSAGVDPIASALSAVHQLGGDVQAFARNFQAGGDVVGSTLSAAAQSGVTDLQGFADTWGYRPPPPAASMPPPSDSLTNPLGRGTTASATPSTGDVRNYIAQAAQQRGIDPDIALKVAQSEGGFEAARRGTFSTGSSWWPFQLHYGGKGYEQFGDVAGMGNRFTAETGIQPGDPAGWQAATDYALDQAKQSGWGQWYGAKAQGITGFQGIDRNAPAAAVDYARQGVEGARGTLGQISQFGEKALSSAEAYSACGPAAAVRFAQMFGRNPSLREAVDLAATVGWTAGQGMAGLASEAKLFEKLGIPARQVGANWDALAREASTGNPVVISTPGHYFTADAYNSQTGQFRVGASGTDLKGGSEWMTPQQMEGRMGQLQGGLISDNPGVQAPSTADQGSPSWFDRTKESISRSFSDRVSALPESLRATVTGSGNQDRAVQQLDQAIQAVGTNPVGDAFSQLGSAASSAAIGAQDRLSSIGLSSTPTSSDSLTNPTIRQPRGEPNALERTGDLLGNSVGFLGNTLAPTRNLSQPVRDAIGEGAALAMDLTGGPSERFKSGGALAGPIVGGLREEAGVRQQVRDFEAATGLSYPAFERETARQGDEIRAGLRDDFGPDIQRARQTWNALGGMGEKAFEAYGRAPESAQLEPEIAGAATQAILSTALLPGAVGRTPVGIGRALAAAAIDPGGAPFVAGGELLEAGGRALRGAPEIAEALHGPISRAEDLASYAGRYAEQLPDRAADIARMREGPSPIQAALQAGGDYVRDFARSPVTNQYDPDSPWYQTLDTPLAKFGGGATVSNAAAQQAFDKDDPNYHLKVAAATIAGGALTPAFYRAYDALGQASPETVGRILRAGVVGALDVLGRVAEVPGMAARGAGKAGPATAEEVTERAFSGPIAERLTGLERSGASADEIAQATEDMAAMRAVGDRAVGVPEQYQTPTGLAALRGRLRALAEAGASQKDWYSNSSRSLMNAAQQDKGTAEKLAQLTAIYSQNTPVDANMNNALMAWYQYKSNQPIRVAMGSQDARAHELLYEGTPWEGRKTNNFYRNLMQHIDPTVFESWGEKQGQSGVTADIWMMRAFNYLAGENSEGRLFLKAPSDPQYDFIQNEVARTGRELGWTPEQTQAAIWSSTKAAAEGTGVDTAGYHYGDALRNRMAQVSYTASPGTAEMQKIPGYMEAPEHERAAYNLASENAIRDPRTGRDPLSEAAGVFRGETRELPEAYGDYVGPGLQMEVPMPAQRVTQTRKVLDAAGNPVLDAEGKQLSEEIDLPHFRGQVLAPAREALSANAAMRGIVLKQDAVPWTRLFRNTAQRDANVVDLQIGRPLTTAEAGQINQSLAATFGDGTYALVSSPDGAWIMNLQGTFERGEATPKRVIDYERAVPREGPKPVKGQPGRYGPGAEKVPAQREEEIRGTWVASADGTYLPNEAFSKQVESAIKPLAFDGNPGVHLTPARADSEYVSNDWSQYPDGTNYRSLIESAGRAAAFADVEVAVTRRVQQAQAAHARRFGWPDNPNNPFGGVRDFGDQPLGDVIQPRGRAGDVSPGLGFVGRESDTSGLTRGAAQGGLAGGYAAEQDEDASPAQVALGILGGSALGAGRGGVRRALGSGQTSRVANVIGQGARAVNDDGRLIGRASEVERDVSKLIIPGQEPPPELSQIFGPRGQLLETVGTGEGGRAAVSVTREGAEHMPEAVLDTKAMPNLAGLAQQGNIQQTIARNAITDPELVAKYTRGTQSWDDLIKDVSKGIGMTAADFLKTRVGKSFNEKEMLTLRAAMVSEMKTLDDAMGVLASKGLDNASPEDKLNARLALLNAQQLQAVATGAASTAGRTLNQQKLRVTQEMAQRITTANEVKAARAAADKAQQAVDRAAAQAQKAADRATAGAKSAADRAAAKTASEGQKALDKAQRDAEKALESAQKRLANAEARDARRGEWEAGQAKKALDMLGGEKITDDIVKSYLKLKDTDDPYALGHFVRALQKPGWWDRANILRYASMLSATTTHTVQAASNAGQLALRPAAHALAVPLDIAAGALRGGERTRYMAELGETFPGYAEGARAAIPDAIEMLKTGINHSTVSDDLKGLSKGFGAAQSPAARAGFGATVGGLTGAATAPDDADLNERVRRALYGGLAGAGAGALARGSKAGAAIDFAAEAPLRLMAASDMMFRGAARGAATRELALRQAMNEGLRGGEASARAVDIRQDMATSFPDLAAEAENMAKRSVYQEQRESQRFVPKSGVIGKVASVPIPFSRTPINIAAQAMGMSPLGLVGVIEAAARGDRGETVDRASRALIGSAAMMSAYEFGKQGYLTAGYPEEQYQRNALPQGWKPWSVRIPGKDGDTYVPYAALGTPGMAMAMGASISSAERRGDEVNAETLAKGALSMGKYFTDQLALTGLNNMLNAIQQPDRYGEAFLESLASQPTPYGGLQRQVMAAEGKSLRDPENIGEAYLAGLEPFAETVRPRLDQLGREVKPGATGLGAFAPLRYSSSEDPDASLLTEYRKAKTNLPDAPKTYGGVELTLDEQRQVARASGDYIRDWTARVTSDPEWATYSREQQQDVLQWVVESARKAATGELFSSLPEGKYAERWLDYQNKQIPRGSGATP